MFKQFILSTVLLSTSHAAYAQPFDAGSQLRQIPQAPEADKPEPVFEVAPRAAPPESAEAGVTVKVDALKLTGATLFSNEVLIAASGFTPGSELTLAQLRAIAARISAYYNAKGYFLAQAYLPPQAIEGGIVTITVIEGRYGKVSIDNKTNLSNRIPQHILNGVDPGDIVVNKPLERRLLLLSDIPGVAVRSTLAPGAEVGTADLLVGIEQAPPVTGSLEADNGGNRYTGTYRLGGTVNLNNPLGIGDMLSVRLLASDDGLAYGRGSYQALVGNATLGVAYAHLRYDLGREFKILDADGTAGIFSLFASYPLVRTRRSNLYALAGADLSRFEDHVHSTASRSRKASRALHLGFAGDFRDGFGGGGSSVYSAALTIGDLDIKTPLDRAADALTARSDGHFAKLNASAARLQSVGGPLSLYAAVRGQLAFDNLDSSEKMELGGAYGVRAYPEGEAYGDQGYLATLEARLDLNHMAAALPGGLELIGFIDVGAVEYAHRPWFTGSNHAHRSGYGAGLTWSGPSDILVKASYARKLGKADATSAPDKEGRAWFQIVKLF